MPIGRSFPVAAGFPSIFLCDRAFLSTKDGIESLIDILERKSAGELDFDLCRKFGDSRPDFQEPFLQGIELGADPFCEW